MAKNLETIINAAREDFEGRKTVAFVGERHSGKTVIAALLKHALVNHFVQKEGNWNAWVTQGSDRINQILDKLHNEEFPASTLPGDAKPISLEIFSGEGTGGGIEITLQDMAGESRDKLLRDEFPNEEERLKQIMTSSSIEGKPYGMLAHLAFANIYVIVVDCSKYDKWEQEQSYLATTVRTLLNLKKEVGKDFEGKLMNPIAIIFSKYDQLTKIQQDTPENLLKKLPEFVSTLKIAHRGNLELFLSEVKSVPRTKKELDTIIEEEVRTKNTELIDVKDKVDDLQVRKKNAEQELETVQQELKEIQQKLEEAKPRNNPDEINQITQELEEKKESVNEKNLENEELLSELESAKLNKAEIETRLEKNKPSALELGISKFRPKHPLTYNVDGYLDFISWIIEMNKE